MAEAAADLVTLLRRAAERFGASPFLSVGDRQATFTEFAAAAERLACALRASGLAPLDRVAILLHRSIDEAVALFATLLAGGVAVPIHGKLKDDQVAHVLADAEPFAVITSSVRRLALRADAATLAGHRVFVGDQGWPGPHDGDARFLPPAAPNGRTPAVLLYTSGSTGRAKGIVQDHHNLALGAKIVSDYLGLARDDHLLALLPFAFDYGLNQLLSALHTGCRLTCADHLGAAELASLLRTHRPTGLAGVPSLWHEVAHGLEHGVLAEADGASLRYVTNSGGLLRRTDSAVLRRAWPHVEVFAMYGLTEAFRSAFLPPAEFDAHPESFGRAIPGVELLLVDGATGAVLHGPATGELVHAGALVAHGYWRRPTDTEQRFRPDPRGADGVVVYSGDIVRRDEAGRHWFVGRRDRLLKVHGYRVSPDEVAAAVAGQPGVGEVAVFGVADAADPNGHRIVLAVAGDAADGALAERLWRRCRARLPSYMLPSRVEVLPQLPHNANGKVDEAALRALLPPCSDPS